MMPWSMLVVLAMSLPSLSTVAPSVGDDVVELANPPDMQFEEQTHDFGKIPQNKPASYTFKLTNTGDEPLVITAVDPACGCTLAKFTATPVLKGGTATIDVTFNAAVAGSFSKPFTIKSNARTPLKVLYIKGEVVPPTQSTFD